MATKQAAPAAPADDPMMICLESFAAYGGIEVSRGTRLRASHIAVQKHPQYFCADGLSDGEMAQLREARRPPREITQHVPIVREDVELTDEESVLCIRGVRGSHVDGDSHLGPRPLAVPVGARLGKRAAIVKANPDCFVAIVPEGLSRENSVRALTDNFVYQRDPESGEYIPETDGMLRLTYGEFKRFQLWYAGQWVSRNHPDVHAHPERFEILR